MVANPQRRHALLDAAVACLGGEGARLLTFRTVDRRAGLPSGTCTNYFPHRAALLRAAGERVFERLMPAPERMAAIAAVPDPTERQVRYVEDVVERVLADRSVGLALMELRLEAARDDDVAAIIGPFLRGGLGDDQAFHADTGLPGGDRLVENLHYATLGVLLDKLTVPLSLDRSAADVARDLTLALAR